ncbi:hypothetical protein [Rhodopseudomonas palustris]
MDHHKQQSATQLSRRKILTGAGFAAGAACLGLAVSAAAAQPGAGQIGCSQLIPKKAAKHDVHHVARVNSFKRCETCRMFLSPDQCIVVEGRTNADSVCELWAIRGGGRIGCVPDQLIQL